MNFLVAIRWPEGWRPEASMAGELPAGLDPEDYEMDEGDGLVRAKVGPWVKQKLALLSRYIEVSSAVRRKFIGPGRAGTTYIDLFCGPGRARIRESRDTVDGSPLAAWNASVKRASPFSAVLVADSHPALVEAAKLRLRTVGAPVEAEVGTVEASVDRIVARLRPSALHFAFLDPFKLDLPFEVIRKLAASKRMDVLVHISSLTLQRNLDRFLRAESSPLDSFAPGWRSKVDIESSDQGQIRGKIIEHWCGLVSGLGMKTAESFERVRGTKNQPLYWLAFIAHHNLAHELWEKIRKPKQGFLFD